MAKKRKNHKKFENYFYFKGGKNLYYSASYTVDFSSDKEKSSLPTFNSDQIHFTPAFVVPALYSGNSAHYEDDHKKKIHNHQEISRDNIVLLLLFSSYRSPRASTASAQSAERSGRTTRRTSRARSIRRGSGKTSFIATS